MLGFRLAGVRKVFTTNDENFEATILEAITDEDIGVLAADSSDLKFLKPHVRQKVMDCMQPVVVPIGRDESDLREKVKRAIGVDLYKTEDD